MIFVLRDMYLALFLGVVLGAWISARHGRGAAKDAPFARLVGAFWEPLTYSLDLRGPDDRPSLSKLCYAATVVVSLAGLIIFGRAELVRGEKIVDAELSNGFLIYTFLTMAFALGKEFFNRVGEWLMGRFPGLAEAKARQSGAVQRPPE